MERKERRRALGVKHIASIVFGFGQTSGRKNGEGNRKSSEDDDNNEYRPPQGDFGFFYEDTGNDEGDESSRSQANMVICVY